MNRSVLEVPVSEKSASPPPHSEAKRDPYRGVVLTLLAVAILGTAGFIFGGLRLGSQVLLDVAITLGLSSGILIGVAATQAARARSSKIVEAEVESVSVVPVVKEMEEVDAPAETAASPGKRAAAIRERARLVLPGWLKRSAAWFWDWFAHLPWIKVLRIGIAVAGAAAIVFMLMLKLPPIPMTPVMASIAASACLLAAALAAIAARYLGDIDAALLPEAVDLCRGTRVIAWVFLLAALSIVLTWIGQQKIVQILHFTLLVFNAAVCYGLLRIHRHRAVAAGTFPVDLGVLTVFGSRANIFASILDTGERQLGIDLRSTWALTVVRRSIEPLAIGLVAVAWLSTTMTVIGVNENGLVERFGVPVAGQPLQPGLHLHWPWPIDRVFRLPVQHVQYLQVGHEGQEAEGAENVLWAVEHAPNEYTLLLGNGRDLLTVDAAVQYLISDPWAWRYHTQNPADALRAIAYRAVMRDTVNLTLSQALSENLAGLTARMKDMIQRDADALGLGVKVLAFTVGGMHPPVPVASDYEAVISAQLGKVTAVADAQSFMNQTVPAAQASVIVAENAARADGANALATAAGEAWSFRALESQYRAAPGEYLFRRRLETLEKGLASRRYTVVDSRFQRDGGELWIVP